MQQLLINNRYLNVSFSGSGPGLVWAHGQMWNMAVEDAGWFNWHKLDGVQLIRYDARGHGQSQAVTAPADFTWLQLAGDMLELTQEMLLDRYILGGQSMGSATAVHAALAHPERLRGLILANPPVAWEKRQQHTVTFERMAKLTESIGVDGLIESLRPFMSAGWWIKDLPAMERAFFQAATSFQPQVMTALLRGATRSNLPDREQLRAITAPTLILAWPGDRIHPLETAQSLHQLLPNARLLIAQNMSDVQGWPKVIRDFIHGLPG